jgi:uroporphyrinogen decarboxylase
MKPGERLEAAIRGRPVDRIPWALWRHFPGADADAESLAEAVLAFHRRWEFDFVKVTPANALFAEAWGNEMLPGDSAEGTRAYGRRAVAIPKDWLRLRHLSPEHPLLAREIRALRLVRVGVASEIPVFQTFFSPLAVAKNLAGEERLIHHFREAPDALGEGLETINESTRRFADACLNAGADSAFFAVNTACHEFFTMEEYAGFGLPYDRVAVDALRRSARFVLLHLHGRDIHFDLFRDFPADIVNWHDRRTPPSLRDALSRIQGAVLGGLDEWGALLNGPPEAIRAEAEDAVAQTGGTRFILGSGCVIPVTTPDGHIAAARPAP